MKSINLGTAVRLGRVEEGHASEEGKSLAAAILLDQMVDSAIQAFDASRLRVSIQAIWSVGARG
jgi:hypothetical protein